MQDLQKELQNQKGRNMDMLTELENENDRVKEKHEAIVQSLK